MEDKETIDTPFARFFARRGFAVALGVAAVLGASTMLMGLFVDDYVHMLSIEGKVPTTSPYDLFCFATGKPGAIEETMGFLPFPWFTDLNVKLHFFRPLSCATMVLDHSLFGRNPLPYHIHSTLWYLAFVWACWLVFRRALPPALAGLAIVLFAADFGHLFVTAWWSNRNALVAAVPAVFGLWAHMRWREDGWRWGLPLSLVGYSLGLLGGELAVSVFGFVGAYELIGDRGPLSKRIAALVPGACVGGIYLVLYKLGGYGTHGSGVYIDPIENPIRFLVHVPDRMLMLIADQFFMVPVELPVGAAELFYPILGLSFVATFAVVYLAHDAWKDFDEDAHRGLIWLVVGALFSCAPVLSTFASSRLLLVPSIGAIPLLAAILLHLWTAKTRPMRVAFWVLFGLHVVVAPLAWPALCNGLGKLDALMHATITRAEFDDAHAGEQIVIVPVAPDPMTAMYTVIAREFDGRPRVKSWLVLSMAQCAHKISRTAPNRIEVELEHGEYIDSLFEQLMRDPAVPFHVGERIILPKLTAEVLATGPNSRPTKMAFEFPGNLDQPPYVFMKWDTDHLVKTEPPKVGETVELPLSRGIADVASALPPWAKELITRVKGSS